MWRCILFYMLPVLFIVSVIHGKEKDEDKVKKDLFQIIEEVNEKINSRDGNVVFSAHGESTPTLFEGDIVENEEVRHVVETGGKDIVFDAVASAKRKWPNAIVPFYFGRRVTSKIRYAVREAAKDYKKLTCIEWRELSASQAKKFGNYVEVFKGMGCYSMIGKVGGKQELSIGNGCEFKGIAIHEMMHALGFWHEQSRMDRNNYIKIIFQNIKSGFQNNFKMYQTGVATTLQEPYDKNSIMHYGTKAFSKNGKATIVPLSGSSKSIGQRRGLSTIDIRQLKKLYCGSKSTGGSCVDKHGSCEGWAKLGECAKNPKYMLSTCCAACKKVCIDTHKDCAGWALKGQCTKNAAWMKPNCCASCKNPDSACKDNNKDCVAWAKEGHCKSSKYKEFMEKDCRKSCRLC